MRKNRNETVVGMFVILGFIMLTVTVFFISGVYFFRAGYSVDVMYDNVSILEKGAPVRMAGVRVGEVSAVELLRAGEHDHARVRVKLFIEEEVEIRENYVFKIQGTHILSEPHIEITPLPGDFPFLQEGDVVEGISPIAIEDLIVQANQIMERLNDILAQVRDALPDEDTRENLKETIAHLEQVMKSLGDVLSGSQENIKTTFKHLEESTESFRTVVNRLGEGEGTVGKLIMEDELYQEIREFVAEIKARPWRLLKKDKKK